MGGPKGLLVDSTGRSLAARAVGVLLDGGATSVTVVLGARARAVAATLDEDPRVERVMARDWAAGQGASLRTGLDHLAGTAPARTRAAIVLLVDLPGIGPSAVGRLVDGATTASLARATYAGRPGHPVLIGRDHWRPILDGLDPANGARAYLVSHPTEAIPCDDIADGADLDRPEDALAHGWRWPEGSAP